MNLVEKKVLVFGTGISGIGASRLLVSKGADVVLYDGNDSKNLKDLETELGTRSVKIILGELDEKVIETLDLVVLSPGVPTDLPLVMEMSALHIPIWGEIELAYQAGKGQVLAITGTNGKTTTTALLGEIMSAYNEETYVVGNIGTPYTSVALQTTDNSIVVAEVSSFQLETIHDFTPRVSAILNITPDHLNRHHTMEAYIEAKQQIAMNQQNHDICVLNYDDELTRKFGENVSATVLYFSSKRKLDKGMYLNENQIIYTDGKSEHAICTVEELKVLGTHNHENVMAAALMAISFGVPISVVQSVVCKFTGVEHRIEFVCEKNNVSYYNDSKGTNPDAAIKGIQAMNRPTILIGGGYDKDSSYDEWIDSFQGKVKTFILTGQTRFKIQEAAIACGFMDIILEEDFEKAVLMSAQLAQEGDAVLLSPACASWGVFNNFEERGDKFKELVRNL